jgi:hypothetical protein
LKRSKTAIIKTSPGTVWGRLCENREHRLPDEDGFPNVDATPAAIPRAGMRAFKQSPGIHGTCIKEAPEFASRPRHTPPRSA